MQNVTHWFLEGYILGCRQWHLRVLRVASLVCCKDFLSFYCASTLTFFTPAIAVTLCVLCMPKAFCGAEAPPPSPPPKGGAWSPRYPYRVDVGFVMSPNGSLVGVTSHITPLPMGEGQGGGATRFGTKAAVISIREGTVLLFYHVTFLSPNNAFHDTKKVTNLSHHRLFTCLTTLCKDK